MAEREIPDAAQRQRALDTATSFIVQAPAGSGKTTLLARRFVSLLGIVERPEEILAITFTKKAAAEMRHRVLAMLDTDTPAAHAVRQRAQTRGWDIQANPNVLKIQTIDSFALEIASQTPQLDMSTGMRITEQAEPYYEAAVDALLQRLHRRDATAPVIAEFLAFLENDAASVVRLLKSMLARRDQWLTPVRAVAGTADEDLTGALLAEAVATVRESVEAELNGILETGDQEMLERLAAITNAQSRDATWQLLRKGDGELRKRLTVKEGIEDPDDKRELNQWLTSLHQRGAADIIATHGHLPDPLASDAQRSRLRLVCTALALAAVELDSLLRNERLLDFTGLLLRAKEALRDDSGPTDLALFLDYKINHLLIDEYQDTSRAQLEFFNLLTEGWQNNAGTTFFAVGDPMQSIYRFRDADVAIFTDGLRRGLDNVPLEPVRLHANFRSAPALVDWCNVKFAGLFAPPGRGAGQLGEVPYHNAAPMVPADPAAAVSNWRFEDRDDETVAVVKHVQALIARDSQASIAVLCRARPHVAMLMQLLSAQNVPVQATDMELLAEKPIINDLSNLHRVLLEPRDELAWFALLRSPLFGLTLAELLNLREQGVSCAAAMAESTANPRQLRRLLETLGWGRARLYELPLREVIEGMWLRCGGVDAYRDEELLHAETWFDLLERLQRDAYDPRQLAEALNELYADSRSQAQVQVMTIHKAKGLEFDHVIVPYLDRPPRGDDAQLLLWRAGAGLLMGVRGDSVHGWLQYEERQRNQNEAKRLLYVACTRACTSLTLTHTCADGRKAGGLARWLEDAELRSPGDSQQSHDRHETRTSLQTDLFAAQAMLRRLPDTYVWRAPAYEGVPGEQQLPSAPDLISQRTEVLLGNLVHRALAWVADTNPASLANLQPHLERWCNEMAAPPTDIELLCAHAVDHIERTLADSDGAWILGATGVAETPLTGVVDGAPRNVVLDRMFVDNGTRWIIDYKTAAPDPDLSVPDFVKHEVARYTPQLRTYGAIVSRIYPEPVGLAIYFTALGQLARVPGA